MTLFNPVSKQAKLREAAIQERIRLRLERRATLQVARGLNALSRSVASAYKETGSLTAINLGVSRSQRILLAAFRSMYTDAVQAGKTHTLEEVPKAGLLAIERKDVTGAIDALLTFWVRGRTADKVKKVTATSKKKIKDIIAIGTAEGLGQEEVAKRIRNSMVITDRARSRTIARTETHSAMQNSSLKVAETISNSSPLQKEWVSVEDGRTRHSHSTADGQLVPVKSAFSVNGSALMHPGDPSGPAGEIINCRCAMVYQEVA